MGITFNGGIFTDGGQLNIKIVPIPPLPTQFIKSYGGDDTEDFFGIAVDDTGNIFAVGTTTSGTSTQTGILIKTDPFGALSFSKSIDLDEAGDQTRYNRMVTDGTDVYIAGRKQVSGGSFKAIISKFSSIGSHLWTKTFGDPSNASVQFFSLALDSSGDIIAVGQHSNVGGIITKLNPSTGAQIWQKKFVSGLSTTVQFKDVVLDASNNIYVGGNHGGHNMVAKINSAGTSVTFFNELSGLGQSATQGIALLGTDVYIAGHLNTAVGGSLDLQIMKFNSSGVFQAIRASDAGGFDQFKSELKVSNGKLYVAGVSPTNIAVLHEFNTSLVLTDAKKIVNGTLEQYSGMAIDSSGNIFIAGKSSQGPGTNGGLITSLDSSLSIAECSVLQDYTPSAEDTTTLPVETTPVVTSSDAGLTFATITPTVADIAFTSVDMC